MKNFRLMTARPLSGAGFRVTYQLYQIHYYYYYYIIYIWYRKSLISDLIMIFGRARLELAAALAPFGFARSQPLGHQCRRAILPILGALGGLGRQHG